MTQEEITTKLAAAGIPAERLDWRAKDYLRYGYWQQLPFSALAAVDHCLEEDLYEDDDGPDDDGRPIIRNLYSYYIKSQNS